MIENINLIKTTNGLLFATDQDAELAAPLKLGQPVSAKLTTQTHRSLKFLRFYWSGLIALTFDYWEPDSGMNTEAEVALIGKYNRVLGDFAGNHALFEQVGREFLANVAQCRAQRYQQPTKSKRALHRWIKEQAGYYDIEQTPNGIKKRLHSISFKTMSEEEFKIFYRAAFGVCWRYVLGLKFNSEEEAQAAVEQMLAIA